MYYAHHQHHHHHHHSQQQQIIIVMEKEAMGQKENKEMVWEGLEGERGLWFINMDSNIMS